MTGADLFAYLNPPPEEEFRSFSLKGYPEEMEVESPSLPAPAPTQNPVTELSRGVDASYSLDEYLASYQPPEAAKAKKNPIASNNGSSLVPVTLGTRSSKNTVQIHEKYQALALGQPEFVFSGSSEEGWSIQIEIRGHVLEERGPFKSKQEAKEALSGRALVMIQGLEDRGELKKPEKERGPGSNYIGQLLEFQQSTSSPQPTFTDYAVGTQFSCTLTIDGLSETFGFSNTPFSTKKAARQNAAKCAIEYFKAAGLWPDHFTEGGGKKRKKTPQSPPAPNVKSPTSPGQNSPSTSTGPSYASQVAALAKEMCLNCPDWRYTEEAVPGFHTVSCNFKSSGPLSGPIGEVRHVYGKKKAKEECARLTLGYLMQVKEDRLKMIEGVFGVNGAHSEDDFEDAMEEIAKGDV